MTKSKDSEKWKHCISTCKIGSHFIWWWKTKENMSVFVFAYTESLFANCRLVLPSKNFLWNSKFYTFIFWLIIRMGIFDFFSFELNSASSFFLSQRFDYSVCLRCLSIWITFGKFWTERFDDVLVPLSIHSSYLLLLTQFPLSPNQLYSIQKLNQQITISANSSILTGLFYVYTFSDFCSSWAKSWYPFIDSDIIRYNLY